MSSWTSITRIRYEIVSELFWKWGWTFVPPCPNWLTNYNYYWRIFWLNTALISGIYGDKGVRCPNTKSLYFPALSIFWHFYASSHSGASYPPNTIFQAVSSKQNGENFDCQNISSGKTTSGTICLTLKLHNRETFGPDSSLNVEIWNFERNFLLQSGI